MRRYSERGLSGLIRVIAAVVALVSVGEVRAQVHFLSSINRNVASVGESLLLTLEVVATTESDEQREAYRALLDSVVLDLSDTDIEFVRSLRTRTKLSKKDPYTIVHLTRKLVLRAKRTGRLEIPSATLPLDGEIYETRVHDLMAYRLETQFAFAQRSILPLVVESKVQEDSRQHFLGHGSAFLVSEDALVTAYHVIVNAVDIETTLPNGKSLSLDKAWVVDPLRDIAILYIDPDKTREAGLDPLPIAARDFRSSGNGFQGEPEIVFTSGWPAGVQRSQAGILFAVNQYYDREAIWLSSNFVRPGDSGGPLLNARGEVIGVVSYAMSGRKSPSELLENVATSTDPRPAMARRLLKRSPHGINRYARSEFFRRSPHAMAARVAAVLAEFSDPRRRQVIGSIGPFLRDLDEAVEEQSAEARLHFLQGSVYHMLGEYGDAKTSYEQALVVSADHIPAAYSLAYCQLALRSYETAVELFNFIRQFEPYEHLAEYGLAQAEMQLLNYDDAVDNLLRVIQVHPNFAPGLYLLGRAYVGAGEDELAAQVHAKLEGLDRRWAELLQKTRFMTPFKPIRRYQMPEARIRLLDPLR